MTYAQWPPRVRQALDALETIANEEAKAVSQNMAEAALSKQVRELNSQLERAVRVIKTWERANCSPAPGGTGTAVTYCLKATVSGKSEDFVGPGGTVTFSCT